MAGDLIIDKVAKTPTATKTDLVRGLAKAWANLNGVNTIALRASLNIASVVDNGIANYTFNFTTQMNGSYSSQYNGVNTGGFYISMVGVGHSKANNGFNSGAIGSSGGGTTFSIGVDMDQVDISILGDLA